MASRAEVAALENYPLLPPAPGQTSNFNNPESRGPAFVILCSVFIGLMWPILTLRLYSKAWLIRSFGWDDGKPEVSQPDACSPISAASATFAAVCIIVFTVFMATVLIPGRWVQL